MSIRTRYSAALAMEAAGAARALLVALGVFRVLAYRGGLCYSEDVRASLPPLAEIADPD